RQARLWLAGVTVWAIPAQCGGPAGGSQGVIELQVLVYHAGGGKPQTRALVSQIGILAAYNWFAHQKLERATQVARIVVAEEKSRPAPQLAKRRYVAGHYRATRERCFDRGQPKRFILRGGGVDRRSTEYLDHLLFVLRRLHAQVRTNRHSGQHTVSALRMMVGADDAHRHGLSGRRPR